MRTHRVQPRTTASTYCRRFLEQEPEPRPLGRDEARAQELELRKLIEALGSLDDQAERDDRSRRLAKLISTTPPEFRHSLFVALHEQLETLSQEAQGSAQDWLAPLIRASERQTSY